MFTGKHTTPNNNSTPILTYVYDCSMLSNDIVSNTSDITNEQTNEKTTKAVSGHLHQMHQCYSGISQWIAG